MRVKEIAPYINWDRISCDFLHDIVRAIQSYTPDQDRGALIQVMYGDADLLDVGVDGSGEKFDFGFDNNSTDPLGIEAKELDNKLTRAKISTELAKAAKTRTEANLACSKAEEAHAKARIASAYVAR